MKKMRMVEQNFLTFEEGCNKYLDNCRARNLREGTINHYKQSYVQFAKFFDMQMQVSEIDANLYQKYVVFLRETLHNDVSINSYLRDFITTMHFMMNEGYLPYFKMQAIKVDRSGVETYSEEELMALLKKFNRKDNSKWQPHPTNEKLLFIARSVSEIFYKSKKKTGSPPIKI